MGCKGSRVRIPPSRPVVPKAVSEKSLTAFSFAGTHCLSRLRHPPLQYCQRRTARLSCCNAARILSQLGQFGRGVKRGDATHRMAQQRLTIFLWHICCAQPAPEGMPNNARGPGQSWDEQTLRAASSSSQQRTYVRFARPCLVHPVQRRRPASCGMKPSTKLSELRLVRLRPRCAARAKGIR